jgi:hypothetical protein
MPSTYTRTKIVASLLFLKNSDVSVFYGVKPSICNFVLNLEYQALGAYFRPIERIIKSAHKMWSLLVFIPRWLLHIYFLL